jgi:hypothetical protein
VRIWRIRFHWVFIPGIILPVVAFGGFVGFRRFTLPAFVPQPINQLVGAFTPQPIAQQQIVPKQLTPARNLVGNWSGVAKHTFHATPISFCNLTFRIDFHIANQNDNTINGDIKVTWLSSVQVAGTIPCTAMVPTTNDPVNGTISGSQVNINAGSQGAFTGSFTTDTITFNQPKDANGDGLIGPVNLLRQ